MVKATEPSNPLSSGYTAKMGEKYHVNVFVTAKKGYALSENIHKAQNTINGQKADAFLATDSKGNQGWLFSAYLDSIAAVPGKPVVTIEDMELSPYEGNPMEVIVNATGTNLKYQWQICYGDGSGWSGEVDLDDNQVYAGTKTAHFKLHTYFGDTIDEDMNFAKARCKVTSDGGTAYSQEVWFVLRDRTVVESFAFTGLSSPVYGGKPDTAVVSAAADKYRATRLVWYEQKPTDDTYHQMESGATFGEGKYYCRIYISTTDAYKFDSNTTGRIDGTKMPFTTIFGKDRYPRTADTYYVEVAFQVEAPDENLIKKVTITGVKEPVAGENMTSDPYKKASVNQTEPYTVVSVAWFDANGNNPMYKIFEEGKTYQVRVVLKPETGRYFDLVETKDVTLNGFATSLASEWTDGNVSVLFPFTVKAAGTEDPGKDPTDGKEPEDNPFVDIIEDAFYYKAVLWAVEEGITTGLTEDTFGPEEMCTRAQAVTFLWRSAGKPEPKGTTTPFTDIRENSFYYKAVLWAVEEGITNGVTKTEFRPEETCSRSQIITFLWRAQGKEMVGGDNPFADVKEKSFYEDAVLWAVENNITTGTSSTKFSPDADCTRGQITTFLYRCVQ